MRAGPIADLASAECSAGASVSDIAHERTWRLRHGLAASDVSSQKNREAVATAAAVLSLSAGLQAGTGVQRHASGLGAASLSRTGREHQATPPMQASGGGADVPWVTIGEDGYEFRVGVQSVPVNGDGDVRQLHMLGAAFLST